MGIERPEINPTFFYGPVISYEFTGDITKDRDKYRIRFTLVFKSGEVYKTQKSGFKTHAEATKAKELLIAALVRNEYIPFDYSVKEYFDYWLYYCMLEKKKISYNTFQTYRNVLYNHLLPALGAKKKLKTVTIENVTEAIRKVPYPAVKKQCAKIAKLIFSDAYKSRYIAFNPAVAALQNVKKEMEKKKKREIPLYSVEQIKFMLYICRENFRDMYMPLLLSVTIGTRISETIGLMYSDVDFSSKTIYIRRQLGRSIDDDSDDNLVTKQVKPKTRNGVRSIPAPGWIIDELMVKRAWYEKQKQFVPDFQDLSYICCHCDGTPFHRKAFGDDFHQLLAMCGLPEIHWHDLRHIYASTLKSNAVNMKAVSEFLGHYSPDFTEDVYIHQNEVAYDCRIMSEVWENIRPVKEQKGDKKALIIPLDGADYRSFFE